MVLDKDKKEFKEKIKRIVQIIEDYENHLHILRKDEPLFGEKPHRLL